MSNLIWYAVYGMGSILGLFILLWLIGLKIIPNSKIGVVESWWSSKGSLKEQIIALNGEAGYQPEVLRGGIHFLTPLKYKLHICSLVTIPQGQMAYVFARDGKSLEPTQTLGKVVPECNNYQDTRAFLKNGGQKGQQRGIIRDGTYAFNLAQFIVVTEDNAHYLSIDKNDEEIVKKMHKLLVNRDGFKPVIIKDTDDIVGIVTIHDGISLNKDDIIAPMVGNNSSDYETYHNNFQDPEKFLKAGGYRGRQYQVLAEGTYFINRLFATVEFINKTVIDIGNVGVVISYIGEKGEDSTGENYKHGELVDIKYRGVWREPLMPGKYAFNTYAGQVIKVPTTNIILKWISNQSGLHKFDENLKEVSLITKDAFEPSLPLSVVVHISYKKAPLVIQRFGDIKMLVDQTLDPMVSAYFKNIGQTKTLIQLVQERNEIQKLASEEMRIKFDHYNLELEEVLIGTPTASEDDTQIDMILNQLRDRQIAIEKIATFEKQQDAANKEKNLREAESKAFKQKELTESEVNVEIESNKGKAEYQRSTQEAMKIKTIAEADAEREARVGIGKAIAIDEQVRAYGGAKYQVVQEIVSKFAEAIKISKVDIVPKTYMGLSNDKSSMNPFESLIALVLNEKLIEETERESKGNNIRKEDVELIKKSIFENINSNK